MKRAAKPTTSLATAEPNGPVSVSVRHNGRIQVIRGFAHTLRADGSLGLHTEHGIINLEPGEWRALR